MLKIPSSLTLSIAISDFLEEMDISESLKCGAVCKLYVGGWALSDPIETRFSQQHLCRFFLSPTYACMLYII